LGFLGEKPCSENTPLFRRMKGSDRGFRDFDFLSRLSASDTYDSETGDPRVNW
jgi:hypothetical protein